MYDALDFAGVVAKAFTAKTGVSVDARRRADAMTSGEAAGASERAKEVGASGLPVAFDDWFARCVTRDPSAANRQSARTFTRTSRRARRRRPRTRRRASTSTVMPGSKKPRQRS